MNTCKHAIITGAGSGLGLGFSLRLLRRGYKVSVLDLAVKDEVCAQLDSAAAQGKSNWQFEAADVADEEKTKSAVEAAVQHFGAPDLVIHSAGIAINKTFAETTGEEFRRVININLNGSFNVASAVLPLMQPGSRLALIASMAGLVSNYAYAAYGSSKFGVVGLATTLRYEYEPLGIRISCICPPEVKTPMVAQERSTGNANAISLKLKDFAGSLMIDPACDEMLAGIDAGQWLIVPGFNGKLTAFAARHVPSLFYGFMHRLIRRAMREQGMKVVE